jgi:universal stress protein E
MQSIKKILVCLDPKQDQQPALKKAIYLAKLYQADIELFLVVYSRGLIGNHFFNSEQFEAAKTGYVNSQKRWVDSYLSSVTDAGLQCKVEVVWHKPLYEAIIKKAIESDVHLIVKSTHHHPTINKVFFTPNDWQLLKSSPIPLLLTKANSNSEYKNVMAAIDPHQAHGKPKALDPLITTSAVSLAKSVNAECHVTHCHEPISYQLWSDIGMGMGVGMGPADFTMGEENYTEYLEQIKLSQKKSFDEVVQGVDIKSENQHLREGYPETLLPELVDELSIDCLVLGSTYHSGLVGSTAEKILDQVDCDILSVQLAKSD